MPIDSHLPQADPFSLVPTFNREKNFCLKYLWSTVRNKLKLAEDLLLLSIYKTITFYRVSNEFLSEYCKCVNAQT